MGSKHILPTLLGCLLSCASNGLNAEPSADMLPNHSSSDRDVVEPVVWTGKPGDGWKEFDRLVGEQKFEEASKVVEGILEDAITSGNDEEWARSLIRWVQLRTALHGYETSVRFLKDQAWPEDPLAVTTLELFYAQSLINYAQTYSWEINQREQVVSTREVDLKKWTMQQIHATARGAYGAAWDRRRSLGSLPVSVLKEFVTQNTYPDGIRSTLRDAVSYMTVELLANTQGWTPDQSNEVYRLDLKGLLARSTPPRSAPINDDSAHPLTRIAALLDDLEAWHEGKGQREAAFEARLERLRRLHASFTEASDRERIRSDLENRLTDKRIGSWRALGFATLAEFVQVMDDPDALVRARQIALQGHEAWSDSVGGQRCLHIVRSIEAPDFSLEAMKSDGPGKRSIGINYKNLEKVYFRAYPVSLKRHIRKADDWNLLPDYRKVNKLVHGARPSHQWTTSVVETEDYRHHRAWVMPPMSKPGLYVVAASARKDFRRDDNRIIAVPVVIGDLVLLTRQEDDEVEVTVLSGATGRPVKDVDVELYIYDWNKGHKVVASKQTGTDGTVLFRQMRDRRQHFVFARKGRQLALDESYIYFYRRHQPGEQFATLLYSDRSIYRPAQTLKWKAVVYRGRHERADYRTDPDRLVTISLVDANHQTVESKTLTTNRFGTASGEFNIPAGRMLGQWRIQSSLSGTAYVRVEEYKRPTFEAKFLDSEEPLRLNRSAVLKGEVKYYFGLPVTNGKVRWRVVRDPVYPWWWHWYGWGSTGAAGSQTVATGTSSLDEDGHFTVGFTPEADERLEKSAGGVTYRYSVSAEVTDEGGETRTASRSFRLGFVAVEAALVMETGFLLSSVPNELKLVRTDLDGSPAPGAGSWRVTALKPGGKTLLPADQPMPDPPGKEEHFKTPGDGLRPRWSPDYRPETVMRGWPDGREMARGDAEHDKKGESRLTIPPLAPGAYRLWYRTTDPFGAQYEMSREFVVAGDHTKLALPALFLVERTSVKVGETARLLVLSGLDEQPMTLDVYRAAKRIGRSQLESGKAVTLIEIPITEEHRGGFGVTLTAVRDHQVMSYNQSVFVPWDNKELSVSFSTFRDLLKPGGKEKWTVKVTGPAGKDTAVSAAEVLSYMYDRSLDLFAPHSPPSFLSIFPNRTGAVVPRASLGPARLIWVDSHGFAALPGYPHLQGDQLAFYSGYGIGGPGIRGYGRGAGGGVLMSKSMPATAMPQAASRSMVAADMAVAEEAEASGNMAGEKKAERSRDKLDEMNGRAVAQSGDDSAGQGPELQLRSDFSETAFWEPHLRTGADGSASIEFTVPDSVTSWNIWVHAVTFDLKSGFVKKEARTVKDLMVRPYLPRFLREGDQAVLKVVVNNASEAEMAGHITFDIIDPATDRSLLADFGLKASDVTDRPFTVKAGGGTNLEFPVKTPNRVGTVAFKVIAVSGDFSDGEIRPIPVLPGRFHLAQSKFVTLKDREKRVMTFDDMKRSDDPTLIHDQMVVTVDAQLFYQVLSALPYLVNYPYECTEQTLNRFLSTGIVSSFYDQYPALKRMGKKFAKRNTRLETWDAADPNRKMALEEIPWLQAAKGGPEDPGDLINVLDPRIAKAQRDGALAKLRKAQTSSGAFPWFPGGRPSPWMTLYLLHGFAKGLEFEVEVPKNMIRRAWAYMHRHYIDELVEDMMAHDCCWEFITFLNYVLSAYPDESWTGGVFSRAERKQMLDFSFRHWKEHAPYLKGYLALTLARMDRKKDALLVWDSVMDSAKTKKDQGTFWAPEDRGWLWYNDTIETHAFSIRTLMELDPDNAKLDGLVLWIFLNKKLNHWKSTKATAEVVYSLAHYLKANEQLAIREEVDVTVGDQVTHWTFEPDEYTGKKNQIVIPGHKMISEKHHTVTVEKATKGHMFASATWHFSTEKLPEEARGDFLAVTRTFFKRVKTGKAITLEPLKDGAVLLPGDELEVHLSLTAKHPMEYVHLRDPRGAGFEPVSHTSRHKWNLGLYYYEEVRDSGENFFFERLPQGEYTFKYRVRAAHAGAFKVSPATAQPMYAPEFNAYSAGHLLTVADSE